MGKRNVKKKEKIFTSVHANTTKESGSKRDENELRLKVWVYRGF